MTSIEKLYKNLCEIPPQTPDDNMHIRLCRGIPKHARWFVKEHKTKNSCNKFDKREMSRFMYNAYPYVVAHVLHQKANTGSPSPVTPTVLVVGSLHYFPDQLSKKEVNALNHVLEYMIVRVQNYFFRMELRKDF